MDFKLGQGPLVPLQCQVDTSLLSTCDRDDSIPFQASRAINTNLDLRRGKRGSSSLVAGNSVFLSSGDGYLGKLLEFPKTCQVHFRVPRGKGGFLWKRYSLIGPPQAGRGEFRSLRGVVVGSLGFVLSCVSTRGTASVSSGKSDLLWHCEGLLGIPCTSLQG